MNIIDACIILFLALGAVLGFKRGVIRTAVSFVGTLLVIVLAFYLKNPLSSFLYTNLPFFKFNGLFEGVSVLNILIYEAIAYLIVFLVLMAILKIVISVTGIIEKILKATIVLGIPSKILGLFLGLLESFVIIFVALFVITNFNISNDLTNGSKYTDKILNKTPFLSNIVGDAKKSIDEIYSLKDKYEKTADKTAYNKEALDILLKYEVIDEKSVDKLIEKGKIPASFKNS